MSGNSVIDSRTGFSVPMREPHENPLNHSCALHLKRVCGVCPHFGGLTVRVSGRCAKIGLVVAGNRPAHQCDWWERQTEAQAIAKARASQNIVQKGDI